MKLGNLPVYISLVFVLTTILTVVLFYKATNKSRAALVIILFWMLAQTLLGYSGFYTSTNTFPPRFLLLIAPPLLLIIALFTTVKGRRFIDSLNIKTLTALHSIRVPVEIVLLWLFANKAVPQLMTFEGRNFDILTGISAPVIYYYGFVKQRIGHKIILIWNFLGLGLLINIVVSAVLAAPFPFQQLAFDQPNIAVLHFPFNWLPSCVVPLVLLAHLATIRQLIRAERYTKAI